MKPKDALGELVKKWRYLYEHNFGYGHCKRIADQVEKALKGKLVVDRADLDAIRFAIQEKRYHTAQTLIESHLPKEPAK